MLSFDPPPSEITATAASYRLELAPKRGAADLSSPLAAARRSRRQPVPLLRGLRAVHRNRRADSQDAATVETSNDVFNEVLCRSMADLHMLMTDTPQGRYPYAGIPWYSTTFGRDGLITALQMLWLDPRIAQACCGGSPPSRPRPTIRRSDAQPGKILHEMRGGEMAALREVPFGLYYGSVDSTPLFVMLAGLYAERTGDDATIVELWPSDRSRARLDRRAGRSATATASSNIIARPSRGSPTRAGRIPRTRSSTPTGAWPKGRSRSPRCKATSTAPSIWRRAAPSGWAAATARAGCEPRPTCWRERFEAASGAPSIEHLCAGARRQQGALPRAHLQCRPGPVHRHRQARARATRSPTACCGRNSSPAGASAPSPAPRRATIRCPTTTARSGRTTMR